MTDKVQKIREWVVRIINDTNPFSPDEDGKNSSYEAGKLDVASKILQIIDSLQEEHVSGNRPYNFIRHAINALDRKRVCPTLKGDALHRFKNEFNTLKQILYPNYNYDTELCYRIALHWASWGAYNLKSFGNINEKEKAKMDIPEEPVSEELEEAAKDYSNNLDNIYGSIGKQTRNAFKAGAQWQKNKMMEDATDVIVHIDAGGYPYIPQMELYDYDKNVPLAKEGDRYKVVLIKED